MVSHASNTRRIAKNSGFLFFRMLLVMAVGLYTSRVVLNTLGIDDYGVYNVVGSIVSFLVFFKTALTNATYRFFTYDLGVGNIDNLKKTFSMSINTHIILSIILVIILEILGPYIITYKLNIPADRIYAANWVFQFSLLSFCIEVVRTPYNSCVIAHEQMNFFAISGIIEVLLKLLVVYLLLIIPFDKLIIYSILIMSVSVIMLIWYRWYCLRKFQETKYIKYWDSALVKKLLSYSGWSILVNAADILVLQSINVFFNIFGTVVVNASFGIAQQVNTKVGSFLSSFTQAFNPQIIKTYAAGDYEYFMKLVITTSKMSFLLLFLVAFPLALYAEYILDIWLVDVPEYSAVFLRLILCFALLDSLQAPLWQAVHATGNLKTHQILVSLIKICVIPLSFFALKNGSPYWGVLSIWVGFNGLVSIVRTIYMKTLIHLPLKRFFFEAYFRTGIVVALCAPIMIVLVNNYEINIKTFIIFLLLFTLIYMMMVWVIALNKSERKFVVSSIKRKI